MQIATKISTDDVDGLLDLFPAEVKIPSPESPERPFTLAPLTVTVLGKADVETEVAVENVNKEDETLKKEASDDQQIVLTTEENTQIQQVMTNEDGSPLWKNDLKNVIRLMWELIFVNFADAQFSKECSATNN